MLEYSHHMGVNRYLYFNIARGVDEGFRLDLPDITDVIFLLVSDFKNFNFAN